MGKQKQKRGPAQRAPKQRRKLVDSGVLQTVKTAKLGRDGIRVMLPRRH